MKKSTLLVLLGLFAFAVVGCNHDHDAVLIVSDPEPATPQGLFSITGDQSVWLWFNGIYERDVRNYLVYRSLDPVDGYTLIAKVIAIDNPNLDLLVYPYQDDGLVNGVTYWYAVASEDFAGQVSELSAEDIFDTPRPEGRAVLVPFDIDPTQGGFNFQLGISVDYDSPLADIWIDRVTLVDGSNTTVVSYLNVGDIDIDIQDVGYTDAFDSVSYAPPAGWSQLGFTEVIDDHTYIIWTADNHFAKLRVATLSDQGAFTFDWGYQTDDGNPELSPGGDKPQHSAGYLKVREQ